jgi:large subunit ribosomal protein L6
MSRIGKKPVEIPSGVKVSLAGRMVTVQGKGGTLQYEHRPEVKVTVDDGAKQVTVERADNSRPARAYHGLTRSLIHNMVVGVTEGYKKELEIVGAGWTAQVQGRNVSLNVGYADAKVVPIPDGVTVAVQGQRITVTGADKQAVGQCAAQMRSKRKPEPYNGRGIKYVDEHIIRKQGKAFAGA